MWRIKIDERPGPQCKTLLQKLKVEEPYHLRSINDKRLDLVKNSWVQYNIPHGPTPVIAIF
jgi:hypothetical protein